MRERTMSWPWVDGHFSVENWNKCAFNYALSGSLLPFLYFWNPVNQLDALAAHTQPSPPPLLYQGGRDPESRAHLQFQLRFRLAAISVGKFLVANGRITESKFTQPKRAKLLQKYLSCISVGRGGPDLPHTPPPLPPSMCVLFDFMTVNWWRLFVMATSSALQLRIRTADTL